jgi:hypothetical protein
LRHRGHCLAIAGLTLLIHSYGRPASAQTFSYGVKAGANVSTLQIQSTDLIISPSSRSGVHAGVYVDFRLAGAFGVQVEGLVSQKGTIIKDDPRYDGDLDVRVNYLDVPVLVSYRFAISRTVTLQALAGPVLSLKIGDKQQEGSTVLEEGEKQALTSSDFGLSIGGAVLIKSLVVDIRYVWGVLNINDDLDRDELIVRNRMLSVAVGWRLK